MKTLPLGSLFSMLSLALCAHPAASHGLGPGASTAADEEISWRDSLAPISSQDWDERRAAHLLERAGFGGTPEEIAALAKLGPRQAVRRLVYFEGLRDGPESALPPFEHSGIWKPGMDPFPESRAEAVRQGYEDGESMGVRVDPTLERPLQPIVDRFFYLLRADVLEAQRAAQWWAERMLVTKRPLEEKMALFWHGHFATSDAKVRDYRKLLIQLDLFHRQGLGNFRDLLLGITRDPAMLVYLDNGENRKGHPNENFGREVLEMFSMGVGHYSEDDIREASRAFTGWTQDELEFVVQEDQHDTGVKTVLGKTGNFDGEDVIDIIVSKPATARYVSARIYRYFVHEEPSEAMIDQLSKLLIENGYEIAPLMETIFLSQDFYSPASVASQIKSPVQLLISTYKKLGLEELPTIPDFNSSTGSLGQLLLHPPNVAGWAGGRSWVTGASLMQRGDLARQILFPDVEGFRPPDRMLPGIYRSVAERLEKGMTISQATASGDSAFSELAGKSEDYNTRYGGYMGYVLAWEVVELVPRAPAELSLANMLDHADVSSASEAVDYLCHRFLSAQPSRAAREELVLFARQALAPEEEVRAEQAPAAHARFGPADERALRELLHLILSLPEYQVA